MATGRALKAAIVLLPQLVRSYRHYCSYKNSDMRDELGLSREMKRVLHAQEVQRQRELKKAQHQ